MNESKRETATFSCRGGAAATAISGPPREKLTKKAITADHPTWCPGCGDFAVLASFYKFLEKRNLAHEKIVTLAGIGCSSRFPYFVNGHGAHFIHGRAVPLAIRHQPRPARSARVPVRRRRRRILDRRQPSRSRRAQEHQHDLFHHGQLRLWADEETDLADLADRIQVEDGPDRRDRSTGEPDEKTDLGRRDVHRAHARRERGSHDTTDRACIRSPGLQRHRMFVASASNFFRTSSTRPTQRRAAASK